MLVKRLLNYGKGYVRVLVEGFYLERFINICNSKKILLWNMTRKRSTCLRVNISVEEYREAVKIAKKTGCKIKIEKKKGLPFIINKYRKRKVFFASIAIIIILLITLSGFVWNIQVEGVDELKKNEIIEFLKKENLKVGVLKSKINTKNLISEIRLQRSDIAWVGIEFKGTNAIIKIVEATKKPEIINEEEVCNIVSKKTAMITKVKAQNGTPLVKEGDVVKKGQVLIGGFLEGQYTDTQYVHSEGDVEAKVWYTYTKKIYFNQTESNQTGRIENKYSLKINNFKINFYKMVTKFKICDTIREEKVLKLFNDFYLPIQLVKTTNYELENIDKTITREEAIELGKQRAMEESQKDIKEREKIANEIINVHEGENYVDVEITYEVLESIGTKEKITF